MRIHHTYSIDDGYYFFHGSDRLSTSPPIQVQLDARLVESKPKTMVCRVPVLVGIVVVVVARTTTTTRENTNHLVGLVQGFVPKRSLTNRIGGRLPRKASFSSSTAQGVFGLIEWEDVLYDDTSTAFDAWEWTSNMGAPAALIAAAVLVTLSETRISSAPLKTDQPWVRFTKRLMRFLLLSSFAFEVASIFVGNMTGSMLLGHGAQKVASKLVGYSAPLELVHHHHEAEYLMTQITFLQGLLHWLGAVVCELVLPQPTETKSAKRMNKCLASWLITLIVSIVSFYNRHVNFYSGYGSMVLRCLVLMFRQGDQFRPMSLLYVPSAVVSTVLTWRAFTSPPEDD